ncbi:hypothetical protein V3C99_014008 [Haemonchus contortus]|uniref:6-phosphofructokinase n=1 Tax=Haemonchus contortus TaxID=6289 RepID=A0A7I4YQL4_HAECO|nr:Phosphofructokinase domain containing protein [Haemonchus contortus]
MVHSTLTSRSEWYHLTESMSFQKSIGVITSGSDAQGMNSAIRSIVRCGLRRNCKVYFVFDGFEGLITNRLEEARWESVSNILPKGGTILGTTRCEAFKAREERMKAALTLHTHKIYHLACIGGDGSLTGLKIFRDEWESLTAELLKAGSISKEQAEQGRILRVVGIAGTIDNDFFGTDRTIGFDSAMARVTECVDNLTATAMSHQRAFIVEVMSHECGSLALTAALALEADFVFIPEIPPPDNWPEVLCAHLHRKRKAGSRLNLVIIAEGATDAAGKRINSDEVKKIIEEKLKFEVRVASLGYLQRGGAPSFLDRLLGCRMGSEAVNTLLSSDPKSPKLLCLKGHVIVKLPLSKLLGKTQKIREEKRKGSLTDAADARGKNFKQKTDFVQLIAEPPSFFFGVARNFAVIHVGTPAAGMNCVTHAFVRIANHSKYNVFGIERCWEGLAEGRFRELNWGNVTGWMYRGGSELGSKKQLPTEIEKLSSALREQNIEGLLIVGGFEAFQSAIILNEARNSYSAFDIPMVVVPCSIANNVPGTCNSLGTDTALNEICRQVDNIQLSARSTRKRVVIVETQGGRCGFLAAMTAMATGADQALVFQKEFSERDLKKMVQHAGMKADRGLAQYTIIRSEGADDKMTCDYIKDYFEEQEETEQELSARVNILCHAQAGGAPSAFDRQMGLRMAIYAFQGLRDPKRMGDHDCCVLGLVGRELKFTSILQLAKETCFVHNLPLCQWWMCLMPLISELSDIGESIYT